MDDRAPSAKNMVLRKLESIIKSSPHNLLTDAEITKNLGKHLCEHEQKKALDLIMKNDLTPKLIEVLSMLRELNKLIPELTENLIPNLEQIISEGQTPDSRNYLQKLAIFILNFFSEVIGEITLTKIPYIGSKTPAKLYLLTMNVLEISILCRLFPTKNLKKEFLKHPLFKVKLKQIGNYDKNQNIVQSSFEDHKKIFTDTTQLTKKRRNERIKFCNHHESLQNEYHQLRLMIERGEINQETKDRELAKLNEKEKRINRAHKKAKESISSEEKYIASRHEIILKNDIKRARKMAAQMNFFLLPTLYTIQQLFMHLLSTTYELTYNLELDKDLVTACIFLNHIIKFDYKDRPESLKSDLKEQLDSKRRTDAIIKTVME